MQGKSWVTDTVVSTGKGKKKKLKKRSVSQSITWSMDIQHNTVDTSMTNEQSSVHL